MPNTFQTVAAGTDDEGSLLPSPGTPEQSCQVIGDELQGEEQVIQILGLGNRAQSTQSHPDGLTDYRGLTNACIGDAQLAVFRLKAAHTLIDIPQATHILTECDQTWLTRQRR